MILVPYLNNRSSLLMFPFDETSFDPILQRVYIIENHRIFYTKHT